MGCSSPNSQRSARCHLSEMDLTRQRLVTFLREEMCVAVLQGVEAPGQKREDWQSLTAHHLDPERYLNDPSPPGIGGSLRHRFVR